MDASNPVIDSTKITISAIKERNIRYQRQDLGWLDAVCTNLERTRFETFPERDVNDEGMRVVMSRLAAKIKQFKEKIDANNDISVIEKDSLATFLNVHDPIPICGLESDGVPIHPTGKNSSGGKVSANLTFGRIGVCNETTKKVARYLETTYLQDVIEEIPIYTMGTPQGLFVRLQKQLATPTKHPNLNQVNFEKVMSRAMPFNDNQLMNWNDDLYDLFENVTTSFSSSAGAPYWRPKQEAVNDMLDTILPLIVDNLCNGTIDKLFKEQPELFLSAVKNKDDRYLDPTVKTRPYLSMPWHWQTLFSVLCQGFCKKLALFHERTGCRNAYGFSYASGGGNKLVEFGRSATQGKPVYAVYGDDVDFYFRDNNNKLYRVCPDFSQMDGSVDNKTVELTIQWIYNTYKTRYGENGFWKNVCKIWKQMVLNPRFLVQGTTTYTKKKEEGLMSGVVGTTLFDTVKAVLAYEELVDYMPLGTQLKDDKAVIKFFKERGLTIKEGTWDPTFIPENIYEGELLSEQKFLGMKLMATVYKNEQIFVPVLNTTEWVSALLTPKDRMQHSKTMQSRYLFDRLRGLLTTGGVFDETFRKLCNSILYDIPASSIVMQVQANEGRGARPEFLKAVGEDFNFCDSSSFPTLEWAKNLYAPEHLKDDVSMQRIFNDPHGVLDTVPKKKKLQPKAVVVDVLGGDEVFTSTVIPVQEPPQAAVVKDFSGVTQLAVPSPNLNLGTATYDKKSLVSNYIPSTGETIKSVTIKGQEVPLQHPTLEKQIIDFLGPIVLPHVTKIDDFYTDFIAHMVKVRNKSGVDQLKHIMESNQYPIFEQTLLAIAMEGAEVDLLEKWTVCLRQFIAAESLAGRLGQPSTLIVKLCRKLGYYVFGPPDYPYISSVPVAPLNQKYQDQIQTQEIENQNNLKLVTEKAKVVGEDTKHVLRNKKTLTDVVTRAAEKPASLPVHNVIRSVAEQFEEAPVLRKVEGVGDPHVTLRQWKREKQIAVSKILKGNLITYRVERKPDDTGAVVDNFIWTTGQSEHLVFKTTSKDYVHYYDWVLQKYIRDVSLADPDLTAADTPWFDLYTLEKNVRVRLYKMQGQPMMLYMKHTGPVLLREHPNLKVENGHLLLKTNEGEVNFNLTKMVDSAQRLTGILGSKIEVANITYNDFISNYSQYDDQLGVTNYLRELSYQDAVNTTKLKVRKISYEHRHARRQKNGTSRSPQTSTARGGSKIKSPGRGVTDNQNQKEEQQQQQESFPPQTKMEYAQGGHQGRHYGRFRLPWNGGGVPHHQNWGSPQYYQYMPHSMGRYQNTKGGRFMAEVPPQEFGSGINNFSQQNDGWPIYGSMVRRPRRPRPYKGRGGAF